MRDGEPEVRQGLGEGVHGNRAWPREDKSGVGNREAEQRPVREKRREKHSPLSPLDPEPEPYGPGTLLLSLSRCALLGSLRAPHSSTLLVCMSPFPLLAPLDVRPSTTPPSLSPLCSNTICCLPAPLPIDPKGPSLKASHHAWLCVLSPSSYSSDIPSVDASPSWSPPELGLKIVHSHGDISPNAGL